MAKPTWRSRLYLYYDQHPEATPAKAAQALGCSTNTASSTRFIWKKLRGYATGTVKHPVRGLVIANPGTTIEAKAKQEESPGETPDVKLQAEAIADELLKKVVEAIKSCGAILNERNYWRELAGTYEAKAKKAEEEKTRVIKAHNEMAKCVNRGELPTLDEIVRTLRRDLKPGEKV